jgi:pyruvate kinase
LRNFIKEKYKEEVKLIAKIETKSAVEDIDRIIEVSD